MLNCRDAGDSYRAVGEIKTCCEGLLQGTVRAGYPAAAGNNLFLPGVYASVFLKWHLPVRSLWAVWHPFEYSVVSMKTIVVTLEIDVPEHATDEDITDWVDVEYGECYEMNLDNPCVHDYYVVNRGWRHDNG